MSNFFYNIDHLSLADKKQMMKDALVICYESVVNVLKTMAREPSDRLPVDIIDSADNTTLFRVVFRDRDYNYGEAEHVEFVIRLMSAIDYFLWIKVSDGEKCNALLDKYGIKP